MRLVCVVALLFTVASCASVSGPFTADFQQWLTANQYGSDDFVRADYGTQGSFGGRTSAGQELAHVPVIFIHGNSDAALRTSKQMSGWEDSISYFLQQGYTSAELYATSWGDDNSMHAATRTHSCDTVNRLRRFVEAVKAYTNSPTVNVISHSMGVTLGRKIIKGGSITASDGNCNVGSRLDYVKVFVGLAGANYGLCNCEGTAATFEATCNKQNGFWPGDSCGMNYYDCGLKKFPLPCTAPNAYSNFLTDLNRDPSLEATSVVAAWSADDDLIMYGDYVWGNPTSRIPTSTTQKIYTGLTHLQTKEKTAADQYAWVNQ